jgi:hypothetical protein
VFPTLSFGDQEFTPQEISARSAQVAGAMASIGLKEGDTITRRASTSLAAIPILTIFCSRRRRQVRHALPVSRACVTASHPAP